MCRIHVIRSLRLVKKILKAAFFDQSQLTHSIAHMEVYASKYFKAFVS